MRTMKRLFAALAIAGIASALTTGVLAPAALGWSTTFTCTTTWYICVSKDDGNGAPMAVTASDDSSYVLDVYPNTSTSINDTVSSVKNRSQTGVDVYFWQDVSYNGNHYCLDADWYNANLGSIFWPDDSFSSHQRVGNSC